MSSCPSYVGASGGDMFDCKSHLDYFFWIVSTDSKPVAANEIAPSPPLNCIIFSSHPKCLFSNKVKAENCKNLFTNISSNCGLMIDSISFTFAQQLSRYVVGMLENILLLQFQISHVISAPGKTRWQGERFQRAPIHLQTLAIGMFFRCSAVSIIPLEAPLPVCACVSVSVYEGVGPSPRITSLPRLPPASPCALSSHPARQ